MGNEKIKSLEELTSVVDNLRKQKKTIVQCHGCFDLAHYGHLKHFQAAKKQGDMLIVTLTSDEFIQKGPGRPFYNQNQRIELLSNLEPIDFIAINNSPTAGDILNLIKPDVYSKGKEVLDNGQVDRTGGKSSLDLEREIVESYGGRFHLTDEVTFSSSKMINQITDAIPDGSKAYLAGLRMRYGPESIIETLESLKDIRVAVIGDTVLDRYIFCTTLGKSGKESLVSYKYYQNELHSGGVLALANHLSGLTDNVSLFTCMGRNPEEFREDSLDNKIEKNIFKQDDCDTLVKTKYLDDKGRKVFSLYNTDEVRISSVNQKGLIGHLGENISDFDTIIALDYGQGMLTPETVDFLAKSGKFLSVNCQFNAGNEGYNFITKYPRVDYACMNDRELRLPMQEKTGELRIPMEKLRDQLGGNDIGVTLGRNGMAYLHDGKIFSAPAFTTRPLDTIGSGDAVLALTSLLAYKNSDPELLPFLGNCIGGLATEIVGNRSAVSPIELRKFATYILK